MDTCSRRLLVLCTALGLAICIRRPEENNQGGSAVEVPDVPPVDASAAAAEGVDEGTAYYQCPEGDADPSCKSICRFLHLTVSEKNGQCPEFLGSLLKAGYKERRWWTTASSMDPVLTILNKNAREDTLAFHLSLLSDLLEGLPDHSKQKYQEPIGLLESRLEELPESLRTYAGTTNLRPFMRPGRTEAQLHTCWSTVEPGDIVSYEIGGPDFSVIAETLSEAAANAEALQLRRYLLEFGAPAHYFELGEHFDSYDGPAWEVYSKRVADFFANAGRATANLAIGVGAASMEVGLGAGDLLLNAARVLGKGFVLTGAGISALYSSVRQTTPHTGSTKWTHTEIAVGTNRLMSAYTVQNGSAIGAHDLCDGERLRSQRGTKLIISRFVGDGTLDAEDYRRIAAERALLWSRHLHNYADFVANWHRVVVAKCLPLTGNAGNHDYWKAVTEPVVARMWDYHPRDGETEQGFWTGMFTPAHDKAGRRTRPKSMFCSKLSTAIWSSVLGNPTRNPDEPVHHSDVNRMLPLNPGACSPWTVAQWLLADGSKYWKSCYADTKVWNPCEAGAAQRGFAG